MAVKLVKNKLFRSKDHQINSLIPNVTGRSLLGGGSIGFIYPVIANLAIARLLYAFVLTPG
jgi:hypothetical protein